MFHESLRKVLPVFTILSLTSCLMACPQSTEEKVIVRKVPPPASNPHASKISDENKALMLQAKLEKMRSRMVSYEERTCTQDSDCGLIDLDCCGCGGGGQKVGVTKAKMLDIGTRRATTCDKFVCPSVMSDHESCNATSAICVNKRCEAKVADAKAGVKTEPIP